MDRKKKEARKKSPKHMPTQDLGVLERGKRGQNLLQHPWGQAGQFRGKKMGEGQRVRLRS